MSMEEVEENFPECLKILDKSVRFTASEFAETMFEFLKQVGEEVERRDDLCQR